MPTDTADSAHFLNRELSWLEFNRRVLEEAQDAQQPLLERVKFLSIFSSNLDEFFEIRVAGIKQQIASGSADSGPDGMVPADLLQAIQGRVRELVATQYGLWNQEILPALATEGIHILEMAALTPEQAGWARQYFLDELYPVLTPMAVDAAHPFPKVLNKSHNLIVRARKPDNDEPVYAVVQVPRIAPRLVALPRPDQADAPWHYVQLSSLIKAHVGELLPGLRVEQVDAFRVTRNSDLYIDDEEAENLLRTIEQELRKAGRGNAVRLEVKAGCPDDVLRFLLDQFGLTEADAHRLDGPISMTHLGVLLANEAFARLKDRPFHPAWDPHLQPGSDVWEDLRRGDVMLHHPYESFDSIVSLLETAAADPDVLAIKMTLYRTSGDSPLVAALVDAANRGKQVTALVEIKARFDEAANIRWGRRLEEAGVHVVYGVLGLKTHCKMMLIVRRDHDQIRRYVHLGTGNYHPRTARLYTDLSLLTANPAITGEVATLFNALTGPAEHRTLEHLLVSPFDLASRFRDKILREAAHAKAGRGGRIIAKMNSLVDEGIIRALYEASRAGVRIDLIIRGICCLRPGLPGVSENIRVISIVGRFLEHSRIFCFGNGGEPEVYLGSADWMPRNFYRRVEVAFPILEPVLRRELIDEMLPAYLEDRVKARELQPDGSYVRLKPAPGGKAGQAQLSFRERARRVIAASAGDRTPRFVPVTRPPD